MATVETYLRQQYAGTHSEVSLESGMEEIFGGFELPHLYSSQSIPKGPWNEPEANKKYAVGFLQNARYRLIEGQFQTPVGSWLWQAGKALTFEECVTSLRTEMMVYRNLLNIAWPLVRSYLRWAIHVTDRIESANLHDALFERPKTLAEAFSGLSLCLLGMERERPLTTSVPLKEDVLTTLRIQQRGDLGAYNYLLQLNPEKAITFLEFANGLDAIADEIDTKFIYFEKVSERLKSFRELVRTDEPDHSIYKYLDSEMVRPFNSELYCAIFNRARSIANHLRMQIYCNAD